jgi:hypothetical protein
MAASRRVRGRWRGSQTEKVESQRAQCVIFMDGNRPQRIAAVPADPQARIGLALVRPMARWRLRRARRRRRSRPHLPVAGRAARAAVDVGERSQRRDPPCGVRLQADARGGDGRIREELAQSLGQLSPPASRSRRIRAGAPARAAPANQIVHSAHHHHRFALRGARHDQAPKPGLVHDRGDPHHLGIVVLYRGHAKLRLFERSGTLHFRLHSSSDNSPAFCGFYM